MVYQGPFKSLKSEALETQGSLNATVQQIFKNAPNGTLRVLLTVRVATLTLTFDGTAPTAGAIGQDYPVSTSGPYEIVLDQEEALKVKAIGAGATTGRIDYLGSK